jgi:hypothetical protein
MILPESPKRKQALMWGFGAWLASVVCVALLFQSPPPGWPWTIVIGATAAGALGSAFLFVEFARLIRPRPHWNDQVHFRWVLVCAAVLFVIQLAGISLMKNSYAA